MLERCRSPTVVKISGFPIPLEPAQLVLQARLQDLLAEEFRLKGCMGIVGKVW